MEMGQWEGSHTSGTRTDGFLVRGTVLGGILQILWRIWGKFYDSYSQNQADKNEAGKGPREQKGDVIIAYDMAQL